MESCDDASQNNHSQEKFENDAPDLNQEIGKFFFLVMAFWKRRAIGATLASGYWIKTDWKDLYNELVKIGFHLEVNLKKAKQY